MKTENTEALGRQRAKPSKIKARHSNVSSGMLDPTIPLLSH